MAMTMTQKILAAHAGLESVKAGQLIEANLDLVLGNDITSPVAVKEFEKFGVKDVFDKEKIAIVPDHFTPNKDIKAAEQCKFIREFSREKEIVNFFEIGEMGIEHCLLPEKGLVVAGDVVIGADSHTCTYGALGAFSTGIGSTDMAAGMATGKCWFKVPSALKFVLKGKPAKWVSGKDIILHIIGMIGVDGALYKSMEFVGDGLNYLSMDDRFTMANMAIEAGGKNGIFPVDEKTIEYLKEHGKKEWKVYEADEDAEYDEVSGCLAFESHEHHLGFISVSKQCARAFVDEERADTARHTSQSGNGSYCTFGEHIAHYGVDVGRPGLVSCSGNTYNDNRIPIGVFS